MIDPISSSVKRGYDCSYEVRDDRVIVGASLGNSSAWIVGKATGALQKMYSLQVNQDVFWSMVVTYGSASHHVLVGLQADERSQEEHVSEAGHLILTPVAPGTFEFHPGYQRHAFELPSDLHVVETVFVPKTGLSDPAVAYFVIDIRNASDERRDLSVHGYAKFAGTTPKDIVATYDAGLRGFAAANQSKPQWVRIFGMSRPPRDFQTLAHAAESYDPLNVPQLTCETNITGDVVGAIGCIIKVAPGTTERITFVEVFSERGEAAAKEIYAASQDVDQALKRTQEFYRKATGISQIITPDRVINDGAYWAKVNMLRVLARYPQGLGFTNAPGTSPNVVGRDLAWFAFGCDFLDPQSSKDMLQRYAKTQYPSGKMPEYYDAITGTVEDYGLNINDDTPLFIIACSHHYGTSGDVEFLKSIWRTLASAADYIVSQRDGRGLVVCNATGEEVYGIAGWRNVVPHLTINGAVTEINSECYAALADIAVLAAALGDAIPDQRSEYQSMALHYDEAAGDLRDAINKHLLNARNGMYVLNIDAKGQAHEDVTGDEVFPVMFGVAPEAVSYRIISRLNSPDFQTEAGLRTVSRLSPDYTPYRDVGLIGGVWPGLSFWYAFAAAKIYPDAMARNLRQGYAQYLRDPKLFNTVPGQFSEWFDGESLVNRGMRLSPWEPPRYLWAAIEGACGLLPLASGGRYRDLGPSLERRLRTKGKDGLGPMIRRHLRVEPLMPSGWRWLGVRCLPLLGRKYSYFVVRFGERFGIFADGELDVDGELEVFDEDVSDRVERLDPDMVTLGLRRGDEWLICVGSTLEAAYIFPLSLRRLLNANRYYQGYVYNASLSRWVQGERATGKEFSDIALRIEGQSFALTRLVPTGTS